MKHFGAIIIGTGQAGPSLAGRFSAAGKTVAILERHMFGGKGSLHGHPARHAHSSDRGGIPAHRFGETGTLWIRQ